MSIISLYQQKTDMIGSRKIIRNKSVMNVLRANTYNNNDLPETYAT